MNIGPMLNLYPDSLGGTLDDVVDFLKTEEAEGAFSSCYILPSLYHTDLDRGFSVIDYSLNKMYASGETLEAIKKLGIELKLDFILNHASVLSKQFQDIIAKGEESEYKDFFINWNEFWKDCGEMTEQGYILPEEKYLKKMFFRKPGLPILMVRFPDGREIPYWNTFYQEVNYPEVNAPELMKAADLQYMQAEIIAQELSMGCPEGKKPADILQKIVLERKAGRLTKEQITTIWNYMEQHRYYLGQMDLNIQSPKVWEYYREVLKTLAGYGAKIVRLDAFAYAPKKPGERNFLNQPDTWELLNKIKQIAEPYGMELLPEIHESYSEKIYEKIAEQGYIKEYMIYSSMCLYNFLASFIYLEQFRHIMIPSQKEYPFTARVIHYMRENIQQNLTLKELASYFKYSPSHFSALFFGETGVSPMNYFIRLKIQKACEYIELTNMKLNEIATHLGFEDAAYFSRTFTKVMGCSPSVYRKKEMEI